MAKLTNGYIVDPVYVDVKVKRLHPDAVIPTYATEGAAGFDLHAVEDVIIEPGETKKIPLGLAFEMPPGYAMLIMPRSGVSLRTKLRQPNSVGVIDSDYRGEVAMMFDNIAINTADRRTVDVDTRYPLLNIDGTKSKLGSHNNNAVYIVRKGDRIAQGIIQAAPAARFTEVDELGETNRGEGGFGSTGVTKEGN